MRLIHRFLACRRRYSLRCFHGHAPFEQDVSHHFPSGRRYYTWHIDITFVGSGIWYLTLITICSWVRFFHKAMHFLQKQSTFNNCQTGFSEYENSQHLSLSYLEQATSSRPSTGDTASQAGGIEIGTLCASSRETMRAGREPILRTNDARSAHMRTLVRTTIGPLTVFLSQK